MITTVTLNAAIDKTYFLPHFALGKVTRVEKVNVFPGGKGINVARVIHLLGYPALATGFIGGSNGDYIERELTKQGISHQFLRVEGESRINLNIIDESNGSTTEILEPGPTITLVQIERMSEHIRRLAAESRIVIFSGSLPKGTHASIYAQLIAAAKDEGAVVLLDASGEALLHGLASKPYFIKPNRDEIEQITGKPIRSESELHESIRELNRKGIFCAAVSLGEEGAVAGYNGKIYCIKAPKINALNTVGCGDSFVAGMAIALSEGRSIDECLRYATAVGTANALTPEAGNVRKEDVNRLLDLVQVSLIG